MNTRGPSVVWGVLAFVIGALPAFLFAGPAFYAAGPSSARWQSLASYAALLFVLAIGGGALAASKRLAVSIGLSAPLVVVLLLATWGSAGSYLLAAAFVATSAVCAWTGTWIGARLTAAAVSRRAR
jgi:hypothetical protein